MGNFTVNISKSGDLILTIRRFFLRYWELVNKNELMALAGQVTYYLILSFFPLLIFFLTLAGYADLNSEQLFNDFKYLIPEETYLMVENIVYEIFANRSPTLLSFGMLGALWASLNAISALMRGMVKAYGLQERRSFIKLKLVSIVVLIIIILTFFASFVILFLGQTFGDWLFDILGATSIFPSLWSKIRLIIQFLLLVITFMMINRMATGSRYTTRMVFPGSLFAATGWVIISLAFSFYVKHFNNYSVTYGSIGGIMILLLWLYWSSEILLLGCALNAVLITSGEQKEQ